MVMSKMMTSLRDSGFGHACALDYITCTRQRLHGIGLSCLHMLACQSATLQLLYELIHFLTKAIPSLFLPVSQRIHQIDTSTYASSFCAFSPGFMSSPRTAKPCGASLNFLTNNLSPSLGLKLFSSWIINKHHSDFGSLT